MTLPNYVRLHDLDRGIRELVINLNRIPQIHTQTNCEGHVWREVPAWPTKNGWIYFQKPQSQHENLIIGLNKYCNENQIFRLTQYNRDTDDEIIQYTINGMFESHEGDDGLKPFEDMNKKEQAAYWKRADIRKIELLKGWKELNNMVVKYITEELHSTPADLPFRNKSDKSEAFSMCDF